MSTRPPSFELLRFEAGALGASVVLLDVEGHAPRAPDPARLRLVVERPGARRLELRAAAFEQRPDGLSASFAAPLDVLDGASFALATGGLLLDLPAPDVPPGVDRTVVLARELNALRHAHAALKRSTAQAPTPGPELELEPELAGVRAQAVAQAEELEVTRRRRPDLLRAHVLARSRR